MRNRSPEFQQYFEKIIVPHGINDSLKHKHDLNVLDIKIK